MESSNFKTFQDKNSCASHTDSKSEDQTVREIKQEPRPKMKDGVHDQHIKEPDAKVDDALRFLAAVFEEGGPSQSTKGELDESIFLDWLKLNVGDPQRSREVLDAVQAKVLKTEAMINELRDMGHEIDDDYFVDLNFFIDED